MPEEEQTQVKTDQVVVFKLADELFATPIKFVREIIKLETVTPVPNSAEYIAGIVNIRGKVVPVLEIGTILHIGTHQADEAYILLIDMDDKGLVGVIVDAIVEIRYFNQNEVKSAPELVKSKVAAEFISGVILPEEQQNKEEVILFVNIAAIISKSIVDEINKLTPA